MELDTTQEFIGKIKQMNIVYFDYPMDKKDTTVTKVSTVVFFDKQNRTLKQIEKYPEFTTERVFNYKNGLLESMVSEDGYKTEKGEYKYDDKKNIIEYRQFKNDTLEFSKTSIYDSKNNPIEKNHFHPNYKSLNSFSKFTNDYKNRTTTVQTFDENNNAKNHYLKIHYDKKGFIIKTESIYTDSKKGYSSTQKFEYDKSGNLTRHTSFGKDGGSKSSEYKNTYDKKGNIIIREKHFEKQLRERTTYEITYW